MLGLDGQPHAVACAKYHVLSNRIGGVAVEYMEESTTKAWVRFRYPRWMYDGRRSAASRLRRAVDSCVAGTLATVCH